MSFCVYYPGNENFGTSSGLAHYFLYLRRPLSARPFGDGGYKFNNLKFKNQYNYG